MGTWTHWTYEHAGRRGGGRCIRRAGGGRSHDQCGAVEVPFLWLSVLALVIGLAPLSSKASLLVLPYLLWVTFAAYLNFTIVRLNR